MASLLLAVIYLAFIGLGLPDSLLGSAWPAIHSELGVPISFSGGIFMIISVGTVVSSLMSDRVTRRLGAGRVTAISVGVTALALFGFSVSRSFWMLCLFAVPYGLGAGSVDAALNNYVALHYASRHMSWLHCMWGVGTTIGPAVMSRVLTAGGAWNTGYETIGFLQVGLTLVLVMSLPLWTRQASVTRNASAPEVPDAPLSVGQALRLPGAKAAMLCFFCYCALEQTVNLWASSYLVGVKGLGEAAAAGLASLFFIGITAGRAVSGFVTFRLNNRQMVWLGQGIILLGVLLILLPLGTAAAYVGLVAVGVGCAPVYPSLIHATPDHFGSERSQAVIGMQMAAAYVGTSVMPPLFGLLTRAVGLGAFPVYLLALLAGMVLAHRSLCSANTSRI